MTTSDDEPGFDETTHADPLTTTDDDGDLLAGPAAPGARWVPAILASLVVALLGIALWAAVFAQLEREYVGVSVVIGVAVGWAMRTISRRSSMAVRIVSVVITAVAIVVATLAGEVAYTVANFDVDTGVVVDQVLENAVEIFKDKRPVTWAIFAAALVLAYLSAAPQKEKAKRGAPPVSAVEPVDGVAADEELDDTRRPADEA